MAVNRKLGRRSSHRLSMLGGLVGQAIYHERIETTYPRAKEAQRMLDSLISLAVRESENYDTKEIVVSSAKLDGEGRKVLQHKSNASGAEYDVVEREMGTKVVKVDHPSRLAARRKAMQLIPDMYDEFGNSLNVVNKLFDELGSRYTDREGGYTRVIKIGPRRGDGAEMAVLEILDH